MSCDGLKSRKKKTDDVSMMSDHIDKEGVRRVSAGYKMDHRAVLAFTDQCTDLGIRPELFTLVFCE